MEQKRYYLAILSLEFLTCPDGAVRVLPFVCEATEQGENYIMPDENIFKLIQIFSSQKWVGEELYSVILGPNPMKMNPDMS